MAPVEPHLQRAYAVKVVRELQQQGFEAYFAGGCVRDQLLGREPKDFDIATAARPEQVRELLGRRRTIPVGVSFGVITVIGPKQAGQIDVATFRRDAAYSDGRHPDAVTFSTAEEDARRRDFTINGMFFDPVTDRVIDFVEGQKDLADGIVRAIGDPAARFGEDKLRMLRAVRFASTLGFQLESATAEAITVAAGELQVVSAERIAAEMRRMLTDANRLRAVESLRNVNLLSQVLGSIPLPEPPVWDRTLRELDRLQEPGFPLALAVLIGHAMDCVASATTAAEGLCRRWRLSNAELRRVVWLVENRDSLRGVQGASWPRMQRILIHPGATDLVAWAEVRAAIGEFDPTDVAWCRERLAWPADRLDPPPLISGDDLTAVGVRPGPKFRTMLEAVRDAQLLGEIHTRDDALALIARLRGQQP